MTLQRDGVRVLRQAQDERGMADSAGRKTYHIWTEGCQMNVADSAKLAAGLDRMGWTASESVDGADLVVLNTCVVRERAEQRAVSKLGRLKSLKKKGA